MGRPLFLILLSLASCAGPSGAGRPTDLGPFSLVLPDDMKSIPVKAIDSFVGEFANAELIIHFDFGLYCDELTSSDYGTVVTRESVLIDRRKALFMVWRRPEGSPTPIMAAVHVPAPAREEAGLTMYGEFKEEASVATARRIFQSVRFRKD